MFSNSQVLDVITSAGFRLNTTKPNNLNLF